MMRIKFIDDSTGDIRSFWMVIIFLIAVMPSTLFLALVVPPFQSPDEPAHFMRAYQVSHGGLLGGQPALIDPAIGQLKSTFGGLPFHPEAKIGQEEFEKAARLAWSRASETRRFGNTALYTPLHYLPEVLGIVLGESLGLSVLRTFYLSRVLNGLAAIALAATALALCRAGRFVMFTLLLLPMAISLYASAHQDGLIIPMTALCFAVVSRTQAAARAVTWTEAIIIVASLLFVVLGRPPYAPLMLVLLMPGLFPGRHSAIIGLVAIVAIILITLVWVSMHGPQVNYGVGADVSQQTRWILHNWHVIPNLIWRSFQAHWHVYIGAFIGVLGWLDTTFDPWVYYSLSVVLMLSAAVEMSFRRKWHPSQAGLILIGVMLTIFAVFLAEYLTWTKVGEPIVEGVQWRYFIPPALAASIALPGIAVPRRFRRILVVVVLSAPFVGLLFWPNSVVKRYYTAQPVGQIVPSVR